MLVVQQLPQIITAVGGLGTAAFGLLDAAKAAFSFINRMGFSHISETITSLTPVDGSSGDAPINALPRSGILETLEANWINGTDLVSQKAIAKSLVKLQLSPNNASAMAAATNVDPALLSSVAAKTVSAVPLTQQESDAYARFDLIVTAILDEAYQHSDQVYRNWTRLLAGVIAVIISVLGGWNLAGTSMRAFWFTQEMFEAILVGLLATPLAPIAKDLSSALATAVNTLQAVRK